MNVKSLRDRLGLSLPAFAHAFNVSKATVERWEIAPPEDHSLAGQIMIGIERALDKGVDPEVIGRRVALGIASLIYFGLVRV